MYSNPFQVTSKDWGAGNVPRVILWSYHHPATKTNQRLQKRILQANIFEYMGSPDNSAGKESTCNAGDPSWFLGWEDPLEKGQAPHSSILGLPWWLNWWRICLQCRRPGFHPWVGRSLGAGHGNPLQYSCLENPMDREAWWAVAHRLSKSREWLSD